MKKVFLILGGILCLSLIVAAMYIALTIGVSCYIAYINRARVAAMRAHAHELEQTQLKQSIAAWGKNADTTPAREKAELEGKLPSLFSDPGHYGTEDNWLATMISREIAGMAFMASHLEQPLPDLKVSAQVDPAAPSVHVQVDNYSATPQSIDLKPAFAWDPSGYAPLAKLLIGNIASQTPATADTKDDILTHLLDLTGANLAAEDVRLSANLQQHPASWQDHEAAALLLVAIVIRGEPGSYDDNRLFLSRATAHLAIAQTLRGDQPVTWPGLIADAGIRTLSGREVDALAHLDSLNALPNIPDAAKTWATALRMRAKEDWRVADVTDKSPLLLKIVWFGVAEKNLSHEIVLDRFQKIMPGSAGDSDAASNAKPNPQSLIPDWGRLGGNSPFSGLDPEEPKAAQYNLDLEFHELDQILQAEGAPALSLDNLAALFSDADTDTVARDASGHAVVHVVGLPAFKAESLRHIFNELPVKAVGNTSQDPAEAQYEFSKVDRLLQGVPGYDFARQHLNFTGFDENKAFNDKKLADKTTWPIWSVSYQLADTTPGSGLLKSFYKRAVPFGTAYEVERRSSFISDTDPFIMPEYDTPELEKIKQLPPDKATAELFQYNKRYNESLRARPQQLKSPLVRQLLVLDPDNFDLATNRVAKDKQLETLRPFFDYNLNAIWRLETHEERLHLSDADREMIYRKHAVFEPHFNIALADVLRGEGKEAEAADVERKMVASTDDGVLLGSIYNLVMYDLDHGNTEEPLALAKRRLDLGWNDESTYSLREAALEQDGKLDEAAVLAEKIADDNDDTSTRLQLYAQHLDHFKKQYDSELKRVFFGHGLIKADLVSLSGKPDKGMIWNDQSEGTTGVDGFYKMTHLKAGDVIVGLDGYKVDTACQYFFILGLKKDPMMDCLIWRDSSYQEVKVYLPHRGLPFMVDQLQSKGQ